MHPAADHTTDGQPASAGYDTDRPLSEREDLVIGDPVVRQIERVAASGRAEIDSIKARSSRQLMNA